MKTCPTCNAPSEDNSIFCASCGAKFDPGAKSSHQNQNTSYAGHSAPVQGYAPADPFDHTAEFDSKDISDNKVYAMLVYLMGVLGIIVALLAANKSDYVAFHLRQALKFVVVEALMAIVTLLLAWTFIVPIAAGIMFAVLFVIKIICFFQICSGKAKEPAIIRSLSFLK